MKPPPSHPVDAARPSPRARRSPRSARLVLASAALVLLALAGCEPRVVVVRDGWGGFKQIADRKPDAVLNPDHPDSRQVWTIELERFAGPDRLAKAEALADRLRHEAGLSDVRIEDRSGFAVVSVGRVYDPGTSAAQSLLASVHKARLDGITPYVAAGFVPTVRGGTQVFDPLNLKQFPGMFTLQIGYYDRQFGQDFRAAAETAARTLRKEGDEAYFYHGPHRSLITVGLFDRASAFVRVENPLSPGTLVESYSPAVREIQKKYPYNLGNGLTLIEKVRGKVVGEQESALVRVPQ